VCCTPGYQRNPSLPSNWDRWGAGAQGLNAT
jgi:hypothetical protein